MGIRNSPFVFSLITKISSFICNFFLGVLEQMCKHSKISNGKFLIKNSRTFYNPPKKNCLREP